MDEVVEGAAAAAKAEGAAAGAREALLAPLAAAAVGAPLAYPRAGRPSRPARTVEEVAPLSRSPMARHLPEGSKAGEAVTKFMARGT